MKGSIGPIFSFDPDAWTCPHCGETYRATHPHPLIRAAQRRKVRDAHKCPEVLPS